ncbi:UNVERIFIED_CONTAM: hypothetical protein Sradi_5310400 [Sesamum radiatum]|uniref:DUF4283 domain-containing protein n=1 Tax=Sesamum radiatum TaxID=300843 RepID=A0AAW2LMV3_SESRA
MRNDFGNRKRWTLQKLSSLSRTTPNTHTPSHTQPLTADGADEDDPSAGVETRDDNDENESPNVDSLVRLKLEFNITEFLALANRVIDDGDTDALKVISDLKNRWVAKFGGDAIDVPPLRSVATRPPTPFRHAIVPLRPAIRVPRVPSPDSIAAILSQGNEPSPQPLLTLPPKQMTMDLPCPASMIHPPPALVGHDQPMAAQETLSPRVLPPPMHSPNEAPPAVRVPPPPSRPPTASAPEIFIGNVPLRNSFTTESLPDPIASSFHNSSRKILHYVPPTSQNGEVIVRPSLSMIRDGSKCWSKVAMTEIIEGGPWLFQGQPIVLQRWQLDMALHKLKHTEVPVWIKLKHLPVEYWTDEGLSVVASGLGKPLYPDAITKACTRLDFARVCVMLNIASKLPKYIVILAPTTKGGEIPCKVDVEYEWVRSVDTAARQETNASSMGADQEHSSPTMDCVDVPNVNTCSGMELTVYNPFDALAIDDSGAVYSPKGPKACSPHDVVFITVVCGDNEVVPRRELWQELSLLASSIVDNPCLTPRTSDHSPLVLGGYSAAPQAGLFRFDNFLARSPEFIPSVRNIWRHSIVGTSMYAVTRKLKALKAVFRAQRKKKRDLALNVKLAAEFLSIAQCTLHLDRHNSLLLCLEACCRLIFLRATKLEQCMLQQHAKIQWLLGGDQCIRLLGGERRNRAMNLRYLRPWASHIITKEEARILTSPVTRTEIKQAFFDIKEDKAPGPDGYSSSFYKAAWPVIIMVAVEEFFLHGRLLKQVNATLLALIPKVQNPELFAGYNQQRTPPRCAMKVDL